MGCIQITAAIQDKADTQRIRPHDAAATRPDEAGSRLSAECEPGYHAFPVRKHLGVLFRPGFPRSHVGAVHDGTDSAFACCKSV